MISKSSIFYGLRAKVLDFYPDKCRIFKKERLSFADWLQKGVYIPVSINNNEIIIESSQQEIASIVLSDIEYLSNNCFEHLQEVLCFCKDERIRSDAWNIVSIYYFGFFVTQALLRLLGNSMFYINKEALNFLRKLMGTSQIPGAGTFLLEKIRDLSPTYAEYRLKRIRGRLHEASWKRLFSLLEKEFNTNKATSDVKEFIFFEAITTKKLFKIYNNYEWPSRIRNKANYIPGYAYNLIENQNMGKTKRLILRWANCDEANMLKNINASISLCTLTEEGGFASHVCLLHEISQSLFILFRELYFELIHRRHLDLRMEQRRKRFISKMILAKDENYSFTMTI